MLMDAPEPSGDGEAILNWLCGGNASDDALLLIWLLWEKRGMLGKREGASRLGGWRGLGWRGVAARGSEVRGIFWGWQGFCYALFLYGSGIIVA